jgi:hypothetical protein
MWRRARRDGALVLVAALLAAALASNAIASSRPFNAPMHVPDRAAVAQEHRTVAPESGATGVLRVACEHESPATDSNDPERSPERKHDTDWWLVIPTLALAVFTALLDGFVLWQACISPHYPHGMVNHAAHQYVMGAIHTNTIEGFWSLFKRHVMGTFHKVSRKYLPLYLAEFQFRYNKRENADIFGAAIRSC